MGCDAQSFRARGLEIDVQSRQEIGRVLDEAAEAQPIGDAGFAGGSLQPAALGAVAGDDNLEWDGWREAVAAKAGEGGDQNIVTLDRMQPAEAAEPQR